MIDVSYSFIVSISFVSSKIIEREEPCSTKGLFVNEEGFCVEVFRAFEY